MERFILPRVYLFDKNGVATETLGSIYAPNKVDIICKTMELPWRNNRGGNDPNTASCIPLGIRIFEKMPGNEKYPDGYFRARKVEGRRENPAYLDMNGEPMSMILIHPITKVSGLRGCIGAGSRFLDI